MTGITAKSYTLRTPDGGWLGQVVLTSDGMFAAVTDYGNFGYIWRSYGPETFRQFIIGLNIGYVATKMAGGMAYVAYGRKIDNAAAVFAERILPELQNVLRQEIEFEKSLKV
jgi:hypothetical protein